jgi:hypothetical protein
MIPIPSAQSFIVSLQSPAKSGGPHVRAFERALAERLRTIKAPTGALVFVSGGSALAPDIARAVAGAAPGLRALVVPAPGVLSEVSEVEGALAASALIWSGPKPTLEIGSAALGSARGTRILFTTKTISRGDLARLDGGFTIGGGTTADTIYGVDSGSTFSAPIAALVVSGQGAPVVEESSACRTVAGPFRITEMDKNEILTLDGKPALDVLSKTVGGGKHSGLIVLSFADQSESDRALFRPIKGIDPGKKAIVIDLDTKEGDEVSFAVRDAAHAKTTLGEAARRAEQRALGSAPRFALFVSCAARGRSLYREPDIDVKILKKRFPKLPIAGMHAAFEIIPWGAERDRAAIQYMSAVVALFRAPS